MTDEPQVPAVVKVARDLTELERLAADLEAEAIDSSADRLMPGGKALVAMAPVANFEAWVNRLDTAERLGHDTSHAYDDPDFQGGEWVPPLQTLCFWSEQLRAELDEEYGQQPTIASEAGYLRWRLEHLWDNEPHFDDFARDIHKARMRLEDLVHEGERSERGAPCLYEECRGVRLVRKLVPRRDNDGNKVWVHSDWHCPRCKRTWDEDAYARNITAAHERTKAEDINGELWVSDEYAARRVGRSVKTIRTWINRGKLATVCLIAGRRLKYVRLNEVYDRHEEARRRRTTAA